MGESHYFTFLDGAFGYDCVRCGAKCCHGLGFGVGRSELVPLLTRRPHLAPFVQPAGSHAVVLDLTDEGCWFLHKDGRCGIEVEDGRAAKPSVCRLFPFTRVYRIGATTVVEPHLLLCPLEDAAGRGVSHRELADEIAAAGAELPLMTATIPSGLSDGWVARERAVTDLSRAHLDDADPLRFAAAQAPALGESFHRLRAAWRRSLALDESEGARLDAEVARPLALLTPSLRFAALFSAAGVPYPKIERRLPGLILAHSLIAGLAARALGRPPSLRSIGELWRATALVREILSRWDRPVSMVASPKLNDLPPPVGEAFDRLVALLSAGGRPFSESFDRAVAPLGPELRPLVLRAVADRYGALRFA